MKITIIVSDTTPGELIKLSQLIALADVVVENGVIVKATHFNEAEFVRRSSVKEFK